MNKNKFTLIFKHRIKNLAKRYQVINVLSSISREKYGERISGSIIFALLSSIAVNFFFQPGNVYASGATGLAQIVSTLSVKYFGLTIPVSVTYEGNVFQTTKLLQNFEKSIRAFSFKSATIAYKSANNSGYTMSARANDKLQLSAQAHAFYTNEIRASETTKTIYATKEAQKATNKNKTKTEKK